MTAYYNEIDPYAAQWLRNLIAAGHIAPGDVDERSIVDVQPDDLKGYTQCHFFAGIGGWSYAARLAGWHDDRPLWTGSCPCQPFSEAGRRKGQTDERHLWPTLFELIRARRPDVVMGEQVAAAIGQNWLDGVHSDLEGIGYSCGATVVPACAVNAPHRRDRLWFVADTARPGQSHEPECAQPEDEGRAVVFVRSKLGADSRSDDGATPTGGSDGTSREPSWSSAGWATGADGKTRRVEPGLSLLVDGVPARMGRLRAYGNAIVPQVAAEVIGAYMEIAA
ncbi:DNA cytosine methyltransferase [Metarhizobium album]|uniref:DNA cytosine methyltransferase n=1 Tax=Metarhizobium album TaxID=2182425 RepID=A0A2U2DFD7_9HYPH|nr:DNA cytosine methyltransferase [Rhizobium album]PWE52010.1 DNA cytosine methyltransferase [Rhizobium album]